MRRACYLLHLALCLLLPASCDWRGDHYERLLAEAEEMNREYMPFTTDSVMLRVVRYYDHWWHPDSTRMKAYYLLGCAYRDLNNAPRALENYQRAAELADTTDYASLDCLMRVYSQQSEIFRLQRLEKEERESLEEAEHIAWILKDTLSALIFENEICNILYNNKEYKKCIKQASELQQKFTQYGFEDNGKLLSVICFKSYMELGDREKAKLCLDRYEGCRFFATAPEKVRGGLGALYIYKGQYFLETGQTDSAEYYYQKAKQYSHLSNNELLLSKGLSKTYALKHQADSVLKYTRIYSDAKEKDFNSGIAEATAQAKSLYDYTVEKKTAENKTAEISRLRIIIIFVAFIALLVVLFIQYRSEKRKLELSELHRQHQQVVNELRSNEQALVALRLEQSSDSKQAALLIQCNNQLRMRLKRLDESIQAMDRHAQSMSLQSTDIVRHFREYRTCIKPSLKIEENHWIALRQTIDCTHPTFYTRVNALHHLSENEYRVCMLVLAGFEPSDIDFFMEKSNSFSAKTRKRLHEKVFGEEGSTTEFDRKIRLL